MSTRNSIPRLAVPVWWLGFEGIDTGTFAVLCVLLDHLGANATAWPSQSSIGRRLLRSRSWVNAKIRIAADKGLVRVTRRKLPNGGETSSLYELAFEQPFSFGPNSYRQTLAADHNPAALAPRDSRPVLPHEPVPSDWKPDPETLGWAAARYPLLDLDTFTLRFISRCRAKGYRWVDPNEAWRSWIIEEGAKPPKNQKTSADAKFAAWGQAARDLSERLNQ